MKKLSPRLDKSFPDHLLPDRLLRMVAQIFIRAYQTIGSPILGGACRFYPTCSCYGSEAFSKHTFFIALKLTIKRILKCRPFGPKGFDPVPEKYI